MMTIAFFFCLGEIGEVNFLHRTRGDDYEPERKRKDKYKKYPLGTLHGRRGRGQLRPARL